MTNDRKLTPVEVAALLVVGSAAIDNDAINATRLPTTSYAVEQIPRWLAIPVVLVVHAPAGGDYDPEVFVVAKDAGGSVRGTIRTAWQWPDDGKASKYWCFTLELSVAIESTGEFTIGVYHDADASRALSTPIPLTISLAEGRLGQF